MRFKRQVVRWTQSPSLAVIFCTSCFWLCVMRLKNYNNRQQIVNSPVISRDSLDLTETIWERSKLKRRQHFANFGLSNPLFPKGRIQTAWDPIPAAYNCPFEMERLGPLQDGGKWMCGFSRLEKKKDCTIYSFGISDNSGWEKEVLERAPGCFVYGYDYSSSDWAPEMAESAILQERAELRQIELVAKVGKGKARMQKTLEDLMTENGHDFVDVVKMDIESAEFEVLRELFAKHEEKPLPFGQLLLEMHFEPQNLQSMKEVMTWFNAFEIAGLRPVFREANLGAVSLFGKPYWMEYTFINVRSPKSFTHVKRQT